MKKCIFFILFLMTACSTGIDKQEFYKYPEKLNAWAGRASREDLCEAMFDYQQDSYILNRILIEFRRRNISYADCPQYEDIMREQNKNKRKVK